MRKCNEKKKNYKNRNAGRGVRSEEEGEREKRNKTSQQSLAELRI